jgi:hypothetical protein
MGLMFATGAYADDTLEKVEAFLRPDFKVVVNGKQVKDAEPLIYDGSSYLPFRQIGELLGATVSWDEAKKTIYLAMPVYPQPGTTAPSTPSTPTTTPPKTDTGSSSGASQEIVPPDVKVAEEITLDTPLRYNFTYKGVNYPTLANIYKGDIYLRWKDIQSMPINLHNPKLSKEKLTEEMYVHIDLLKPYWKDEVKGDVRPYAIVEGGATVSEDKLKVLNEYFNTRETGLTIRKLDNENEYEVLAQGSDKWFVVYSLRYWQQFDGTWSISSTGWKTFPKETETTLP